jgi:hypothetical protein
MTGLWTNDRDIDTEGPLRWIALALRPFLYDEHDDGQMCTEAALAVHASLTEHGVLEPPRSDSSGVTDPDTDRERTRVAHILAGVPLMRLTPATRVAYLRKATAVIEALRQP